MSKSFSFLIKGAGIATHLSVSPHPLNYRDLIAEYERHEQTWDDLFPEAENIHNHLNWFQNGFAPMEHWFQAPPAAILTAEAYACPVVVLDEDTAAGNCTYLPLYACSKSAEPICIVFAQKNHWKHAKLVILPKICPIGSTQGH